MMPNGSPMVVAVVTPPRSSAEILDASIILNSSDLFGHGMDLIATALQGKNHIVRAQVGMGDINFAESNAGGDGAQSKSSVVEQWNQQVNGGRRRGCRGASGRLSI